MGQFVEDETNGIDNVPGWTTAPDVNLAVGNIDILRVLGDLALPNFAVGSDGYAVDLGGITSGAQVMGTPGDAHGYLRQDLAQATGAATMLDFDFASYADAGGMHHTSDFGLSINDTLVATFVMDSDVTSSWIITDLTGGLIHLSAHDVDHGDGEGGWQTATVEITNAFGPVTSVGYQAGGLDSGVFDPTLQMDDWGPILNHVALVTITTGGTPTEGDDLLGGSDAAEQINGLGGDDRIVGFRGDDTLIGGSGNDVMDGGMGNDTLLFGGGDDTVYGGEGGDYIDDIGGGQLAGENVICAGAGADLVWAGEGNDRVFGDAGNDSLTGDSGNDSLDGGNGIDTMVGVDGDDTYYVDDIHDIVDEAPFAADTGGVDSVFSSVNYGLTAFVENLTLTGTSAVEGIGNALDNHLTGNDLSNLLSGLDGNDRLDGGLGSDVLIGGMGDDVYVIDGADDVVTETKGQGDDRVESSVSCTLAINVEGLTLTGSEDINGTGNSGRNVITGNAGANVLDGVSGKDRLIGGSGNDTYIYHAGTTIVENKNAGIDLVISGMSVALSANLENLTLTGSAQDGTGNKLGNLLTGNDAANVLSGGDGADTLIGGEGDDTLYGGVDTAVDVFVFASASDSTKGAGRDVIYDFVSGKDLVDLHLIDANDAQIGDQAFVFAGTGPAAHAIWALTNGTDLMISGDTNGDAVADFRIVMSSLACVVAGDLVL